jgi:Cft2 family RNA processing exonuclease
MKICQSVQDLDAYPSPKVILATVDSIETGYARDLFFASCTFAQNMILLTSRGSPGSLRRKLFEMATHKAKVTDIDAVVHNTLLLLKRNHMFNRSTMK